MLINLLSLFLSVVELNDRPSQTGCTEKIISVHIINSTYRERICEYLRGPLGKPVDPKICETKYLSHIDSSLGPSGRMR